MDELNARIDIALSYISTLEWLHKIPTTDWYVSSRRIMEAYKVLIILEDERKHLAGKLKEIDTYLKSVA